ncbi:hypothetical protein [Helicobacter sp. T3_23-1056]
MKMRKILGLFLKPLSKILRKILGFWFLFCVIFGNVSFGVDYTDYSLPSTITLRTNEQRQDATISVKGNGEAYSFSANTVQIIGASGATYELKADNSVTTFYLRGGFTLNNQARFALTGYHTLAFESGGISVGANSQLSYISSTQNISAGGTEYGGNPKVRFGRGTSLSLGTNASATFSDTSIFIHDGGVNLSQGANLKIEATKSIRFQESLANNGGTITLTGNTYNIGGKRGNIPNDRTTIANFQSTNGTIIVNGNFYNGGQADNAVDITGNAGGFNAFDPAFGGGGNLNIYGGSMTINGSLISTKGGDGVWGGDIINPQNSSIGIYGGTLSTTGGVQNLVGSTITIGADSGGKLGQIIGNVSNNGTFIIDASGASDGNHTFITGTLTGQAILRNGNTEFATSNLSADKKSLQVTLDTKKIASFTHTLNPNQSATLNALGSRIYTTNGASSTSLTQLAQNLNYGVFSAFVSSPFAFISYLKSSLDSTSQTITNNPKSTNKSNALSINLIGSGLSLGTSTDGVKSAFGGSGGVKISFAKDLILASLSRTRTLPATLALNAGYTYTTLKTSSQSSMLNQDISLNAQTAGIEAILLLGFADKRFGFSTNLGGFMSFLEAHRTLDSSLISAKSPLKSSFALYQVALDSIFSYDFASFVSANSGLNVLAPYIGLHQSINILPSFAESSDEVAPSQMKLKSNDYTAYHLGLIAGVKYSFLFSRFASSQSLRLNAKMQYEYVAYHSQKSLDFAYIASQSTQNNQSTQIPQSAQNLSFGMPLAHKLNANLGVEKDFANGLNLGLNITFDTLFASQYTNSSPETLNQQYYFYGANATLGYRF